MGSVLKKRRRAYPEWRVSFSCEGGGELGELFCWCDLELGLCVSAGVREGEASCDTIGGVVLLPVQRFFLSCCMCL